jgi:hypothetical protein
MPAAEFNFKLCGTQEPKAGIRLRTVIEVDF